MILVQYIKTMIDLVSEEKIVRFIYIAMMITVFIGIMIGDYKLSMITCSIFIGVTIGTFILFCIFGRE